MVIIITLKEGAMKLDCY